MHFRKTLKYRESRAEIENTTLFTISKRDQDMQKRTMTNITDTSTPLPYNRTINKIIQEANQESLARDEFLTVKDNLKKSRLEDDSFDAVGRLVATKLRRLPKEQMLIAEKLINDILFQAELGNLFSVYTRLYELPLQPFEQYIPPISTSSFNLNHIKHPFSLTSSFTHQTPQLYQLRPMQYGNYEYQSFIGSTFFKFLKIFKIFA